MLELRYIGKLAQLLRRAFGPGTGAIGGVKGQVDVRDIPCFVDRIQNTLDLCRMAWSLTAVALLDLVMFLLLSFVRACCRIAFLYRVDNIVHLDVLADCLA